MSKTELLEEIKQVVRNVRVLRYSSSDEELKGFRIHLVEEDWDKLENLIGELIYESSKEVRDESILHPHFKALEEAMKKL